MRAHRGKQLDWSKPFKLIDSKPVFEDLDTDNNQLVININAKAEANASINKKQQIIVPKIQIVKRITQPKKFARVDANYIRLAPQLNLPKLQSYELNQVDHVFLQGHANKFKFNGKLVLTPQLLSRAFIYLQKKAGKEPSIPRIKNWMASFVEKQYKELTAMSNYQNFTQVFYNYWKNRREQLKFPMLRQLWHPNPQEYNHLLAFKPRQKQKRNLRRNNRLPEDQIAQQMQQQFLLATKIAERIKIREQLKLKQIQVQLTNFHNDCKQFFGLPNFFTQFDPQVRARDKEKLKKLQTDIENIKKMQIQQQKQNEVENAVSAAFDQKLSIGQFLATVINTAESFGINYDRIFNDKSLQKPPATVVTGPIIEEVQVQDQKCDYMSMKLYRNGNTIYRFLGNTQDETELNFTKIPKDIFEYKTRELQLYYYGSDDQGDTKDLKRNISTGFKRFQQMKLSGMYDL